jgi:thymus-specific serine protease
MVVWMRLKYPHLVKGVWASSAPVNAQVDFAEYKDVMTDAIKRLGGDLCFSNFENAFKQMEDDVMNGNGEKIFEAFELCSPIESPSDIAHFFYETSDIVAGLVQTHRPGKIETACHFMKTERDKGKSELEAFAAWVRHGNLMCLEMSYEKNLEKYRNVEWGSEANQQMRQWTYQTCTEFAWFQTSTSPNQIFGSLYPVDYFVELCKDLYDDL